jgi:hypothetical protein
MQEKMIEDNGRVEEFLRTKYTNAELYTWMLNSMQTLYYQTYTLAYNTARKAERAYQFEHGLASSNFIQYGDWNSNRDGLLAGEQLSLGLRRLEQAHTSSRGHDFEISKTIPPRYLNANALNNLRIKASSGAF